MSFIYSMIIYVCKGHRWSHPFDRCNEWCFWPNITKGIVMNIFRAFFNYFVYHFSPLYISPFFSDDDHSTHLSSWKKLTLIVSSDVASVADATTNHWCNIKNISHLEFHPCCECYTCKNSFCYSKNIRTNANTDKCEHFRNVNVAQMGDCVSITIYTQGFRLNHLLWLRMKQIAMYNKM